MKIIKRDEFLKLPAGILFQKGKPWVFEIPLIKGRTIIDTKGRNIDFHYETIFDCDGDDDDVCIDTWDKMLDHRAEFEAESTGGRDGCFNDDDLFMVYDNKDRENIRAII